MTMEISVDDFLAKVDPLFVPVIRSIVKVPQLNDDEVDSTIFHIIEATRQLLSTSPSDMRVKTPNSVTEYYCEYFGSEITRHPCFGYKPFLFKLLNGLVAYMKAPKNYTATAVIREACDDLESHYQKRIQHV